MVSLSSYSGRSSWNRCLVACSIYYLILYRKVLPTPCYRPCFKIFSNTTLCSQSNFYMNFCFKIYSYIYCSEIRGQVGWTLPTHLPPSLFVPSILQQLFLEGNLRNPGGSKEYSLKMTALQQLFEVVSVILFSILGIERHDSWKWVSQGLISSQNSKQFQSVWLQNKRLYLPLYCILYCHIIT